jgi:uncharacterized protein YndB with AHSA1/START domain
MSVKSYTTEIQISTKPDSVYKALTVDIDKWWTELSNKASHVGDQLVVHFEDNTKWVMIISKSIHNQSLVWKVVKANHDIADLTKKDEWKGTTIKWVIVENEAGSRLTLTHQGLVPKLECFEICEAGWGYFLGSLKDYLETGKGYPYKKATTG